MLLVPVLILEDNEHGSRDDPQIERKTPILDVIQIISEAVGDRSVAAKPVDLGPPRYANLAAMPPVVFLNVGPELGDKIWTLRPRPDQTHLPTDHIKQLR